MEFEEVIKNRRSIRIFEDREIDRKLIEKIIEAGQYAPSACNKQAWKFIVLDDMDIKEKLVNYAGGSHLLKLCPFAILVLYERKITPQNSANIQSASAAIQNMLLKATELGLGSCWVSSLSNERKAKKFLKIPKDYILVAYVCLGYPKVKLKSPPRKKIENIYSYNFYDFVDRPYIKSHNPKKWTLEELKKFRSYSIWATNPGKDAYLGIWKETKKEIEIISSLLKENEKILEILPFAGTIGLNLLKDKNFKYTIFEFSDSNKRFIDERKKSMKINKEIEFLIGTNLNTGEKFDTIICSQKLEEVNNPSELINKIYDSLKIDGRFIISFRNRFSFNLIHYFLFYKLGLKYKTVKNTGPFKPVNYFKMKKILERKFKIKKAYGISLFPNSLGRESKLKFLSRIVIFECLKK